MTNCTQKYKSNTQTHIYAIQGGAEPTDTFLRMIIIYTTRKWWNETRQLYAQNKKLFTYLLPFIDNTLQVVSFICNTFKQLTKLKKKNSAKYFFDLWSQFHPEQHASAMYGMWAIPV
jgi:hypothetical protein